MASDMSHVVIPVCLDCSLISIFFNFDCAMKTMHRKLRNCTVDRLLSCPLYRDSHCSSRLNDILRHICSIPSYGAQSCKTQPSKLQPMRLKRTQSSIQSSFSVSLVSFGMQLIFDNHALHQANVPVVDCIEVG